MGANIDVRKATGKAIKENNKEKPKIIRKNWVTYRRIKNEKNT